MLRHSFSGLTTSVEGAPAERVSQNEILNGNLEDFFHGAGGGPDESLNIEGNSALCDVANVIATTERLAGSDHEIFTAGSWKDGEPLKLKSLALDVSSCIRVDFDRISGLFPLSDFNPHFKIFKDLVEALDPRLLGMYKLTHPLNQREWADTVLTLNGFVAEIRKRANQADFVKLIRHYARKANKNQSGLNSYIDKLFEYKSRLLVVRVDLSYSESYSVSEQPVSYEEAYKHRVELLDALRYRLFKDSYVGFAWKLEFGLISSLHYHLLLFLDGSRVRLDVRVAKIIGEYWNHEVTRGRGRYWNCNANKASYGKFCGLGMINHSDYILRGNLKKAASYLVKSDYYVRSVVPSKRRTFGKGIPPARAKSNRGRPRHE